MVSRIGQFIDGRPSETAERATFVTSDPSTGRPLAELPDATAADLDRAVAVARGAYERWRRVAPADRGRLLTTIAGRLRADVAELAHSGAEDTGLPLQLIERDVEATARYFEYYGGLADKVGGEVIPLGDEYLDYTERVPWGVCGVVLPYNSPFQILARSAAPALAAGNAVVAKAAEQAPLGPLAIARLAAACGLPDGLLNVVTGAGPATGAGLVAHPGVDRITFTGSEATGRRVMAAAAEQIKPVTLELGGKSPQIVFADADVEDAVDTIVGSLMASAGQVCSAGTRLLVERSVHEEVVAAAVDRARRLRIGPATESPDVGPLISEVQRARVLDAIAAADAAGARRVTGNGPLPDSLSDGYFVAPTIFDGVDPSMALANEEVFGPVLAVLAFEGDQEAVEIANGTRFGLAAGVWTRDVARAHRVARELESGQVFVNTYSAGTGIEIPFGGFKRSGVGREKGVAGYLEYTQVKNVCVKVDSHV